MKHFFLAICLLSVYTTSTLGQFKDSTNGSKMMWRKENLFAGGGTVLSFFNNRTVIGASPYFGYSITKQIDVALSINANYISQRNNLVDADKIRQLVLAPGALIRIYPVKFLYAELHAEKNFIRQKYIPPSGSGFTKEVFNYKVNTLLAGVGYASDREYDDDEFYFISLSFDVFRKEGSPYSNGPNGLLPIVKAGYNLKLFPVRHSRKR